MYDKLLTKCKWLTWGCLIVFTVITIAAINVMVIAKNTKVLIVCGVVILGVGQLEVLMKLWYWIMNNKLKVLKEIKQLQVQIAELSDKKSDVEN